MSKRERFLGVDTDNHGITAGVSIDPRSFHTNALKQIIRFQVFRDDPIEVWIHQKDSTIILLNNTILKHQRTLPPNDRFSFLRRTAARMANAREIEIRRP